MEKFAYLQMLQQFPKGVGYREKQPTAAMISEKEEFFKEFQAKALEGDFEYFKKTETTTQLQAQVEEGHNKELLKEVYNYFKDRTVGLRGNQIPVINDDQLKLETTQEHAKGLADWLYIQEKKFIVPNKNVFLGGKEKESDVYFSRIGRDGEIVHPTDPAKKMKGLVEEYVKECKNVLDVNFEGFSQWVRKKGQDPKNKNAHIDREVFETIKDAKSEFTHMQPKVYRDMVRDAIKNKDDANMYRWALAQFKSVSYKFTMGADKKSSKLKFKGELRDGGQTMEIAEYNFAEEMKEVKGDDVKNAANAGLVKGGKAKGGAGYVGKMNRDKGDMCSKVKKMLKFNGEYGVEQKLTSQHVDGMDMFKNVVYMLRNSAKVQEVKKETTTEQGK